MILVNLKGGLGNQMFQYALGRHLAEIHQSELKLDLRFLLDRSPRENFVYRDYQLDWFKIKAKVATDEDIKSFFTYRRKFNFRRLKFSYIPNYQVFKEKLFNFDSSIFYINPPIYLDGYFQSEKYFENIVPIIREEFTFKNPLSIDYQLIKDDIVNSNSVCVHIRRQDYVYNPIHTNFLGFIGEEYYQKAIHKIITLVVKPKFFIFSDDIDWCISNLKINQLLTFCKIGQENEDVENTLKLMSLCKNFVISNSTFAWWAAWLASNQHKIVISPQNWFKDLNYNQQSQDLIPQNWLRI